LGIKFCFDYIYFDDILAAFLISFCHLSFCFGYVLYLSVRNALFDYNSCLSYHLDLLRKTLEFSDLGQYRKNTTMTKIGYFLRSEVTCSLSVHVELVHVEEALDQST
jgi:hypothetical protein